MHPPARPLPEVAAEIELLDTQREKMASTGSELLQQAFNEQLTEVDARVERDVAMAAYQFGF